LIPVKCTPVVSFPAERIAGFLRFKRSSVFPFLWIVFLQKSFDFPLIQTGNGGSDPRLAPGQAPPALRCAALCSSSSPRSEPWGASRRPVVSACQAIASANPPAQGILGRGHGLGSRIPRTGLQIRNRIGQGLAPANWVCLGRFARLLSAYVNR
jgi:hypothetical protein